MSSDGLEARQMDEHQRRVERVRRRLVAEPDAIEEELLQLRRSGCSIVDSIKVIRDATGIGLGNAKIVVHNSQTWQDRRAAHETFHDELERMARDVADSSTS
jgi:ribosomal protein L7/L12